MSRPLGSWSLDERLSEISAGGDPLEVLNATVDFEIFRPILERAAGGRAGAKGGRPARDVVLKFRMLVLQSLHGLNPEATERLVRDRLSWMRFCGLDLADPVPDANTLWDFREALIRAEALEDLFGRLEQAINAAGRPDRRCDFGGSSETAQQRWREGRDQGRREGCGDLVRQAGKDTARRRRCALDDQVFQGEAGRGQDAGRHRRTRLRL